MVVFPSSIRGQAGCNRNWCWPLGFTDTNSVSYATGRDRSVLMGCSSRKNTTAPSGTAWLRATCLPDSSFHSSSDFSTKNVLFSSHPNTSTRYRLVMGKREDKIILGLRPCICSRKAMSIIDMCRKISRLLKRSGKTLHTGETQKEHL